MRLQACLNGARAPREHPALPVTTAALAHDAAEVRRAGAESLRIVPRDANGRVSLAAADVAAALAALRNGGNPRPVLLHGRNAGVWPAVDMAAVHGLAARAGFEDGLTLPGGVLATGNAALVACAARALARGA